MDFFNSSYQEAFWLPLAANFIIFILTLIVQLNKRTTNTGEVKLVVINVERPLYIQSSTKDNKNNSKGSSSSSSEHWPIIMFGGLFLLTVLYAQNQTTILKYTIGVSSSIFFFQIFSIFRAYIINTVSGKHWNIFLMLAVFCSLFTLIILHYTLNPLYNINNLNQLERIANKNGFGGIIDNYGGKGFMFIAYQTVGFIVLAIACVFTVLSLMYYNSYITLQVKTKKLNMLVHKRLYRYFGKPVFNSVVLILLYSFTFLTTSGLLYKWIS